MRADYTKFIWRCIASRIAKEENDKYYRAIALKPYEKEYREKIMPEVRENIRNLRKSVNQRWAWGRRMVYLYEERNRSQLDLLFYIDWEEADGIDLKKFIVPLRREIKKLENEMEAMKIGREGDLAEKIKMARQLPIGNFVEVNRAGMFKCIFHEEKKASAKLYDNNKFYCFGCNKRGDVITLIMQLYNLNFMQAVKYLIR